IEFYEANAERLCEYVPAQRFDLVYSFGVVHHSPEPGLIISEVRTHFVEPGTTLKLMVYNRFSWKVMQMLLSERVRFRDLDAVIAKHSEAQTGCPVTYSYSKRTVRDLIGGGFEITDAFIDHIFPYRVSKYVKYEYEKEWYFRLLPEALFRT